MAQCQCSHESLSVQNRRGQCRWSPWPTDQVTWSRLFKSEHNHANWIALTDRYPNQFNSLRKSFRTGYNGMRDNRKAPLKIFFFPRFPWQHNRMEFLDKYHVCKKNELAEVNQLWQKIFVCNLRSEPAKENIVSLQQLFVFTLSLSEAGDPYFINVESFFLVIWVLWEIDVWTIALQGMC